ncbi:hypothetical protein NM688_g1225 [Phlebia brevispora]|uniref:Uncharacterized protein n=1 Tax=Phlebia brevispora TaxID=194682 RepID=A0ACC1TCE9_9APHY|nr:hypothetical protein NM688_g1225 [Phlebia brevispora]
MADSQKAAFREALASAKNIIVLSGAGLSVASGISTFRGSTASTDVNLDYHTPEAFKTVPGAVWFYHQRMRAQCFDAQPNDAHKAIAALSIPVVQHRIARAASTAPVHVTQNIDELGLRVLGMLPEAFKSEEQASNVIQMHGSIFSTRCTSCRHVHYSLTRSPSAKLENIVNENASLIDVPEDSLPRCGGDEWQGSNRYGKCGGLLRPDVVWFGEIPPLMGEIARRMNWCDLLIVVGTSFTVQPAAGFAKQVKDRGGKVAVFNAEPSAGDALADYLFLGKCEETLPEAMGVTEDIARLWP